MFKYLPLLKRKIPVVPHKPSVLEQTRGLMIQGPMARFLTDVDHAELRHCFEEMVTIEELFNHALMRLYELQHEDLDDIFGMIGEDIPALYFDDDPMVDVVAGVRERFVTHFDQYCALVISMHRELMHVIPRTFIQPPEGMSFEQTLWKYVDPEDKTSDLLIEIIFVLPG